MELLLIFLSVLPVFLLGRYIYKNDFDPEPRGLLVSLFFMGIGSIVVTLLLTGILEGLFPFFSVENEENLNALLLIPYVFIGVALIEEFSKWIFVYLFSYHHREFNHAYDGIVYATFVSLGFACLENILYVFSSGVGTAIMRGLTAVPGHVCFGILMGFYLGMAKTAERHGNMELVQKNKWKSLIFPILAHGLYDYLIFASPYIGLFGMLFFLFVVRLFTDATQKVQQLARIRYNIQDGTITPNMPTSNMTTSSITTTNMPTSNMSTPSTPTSNMVVQNFNTNFYQVSYYQYRFCPICGEKVVGKFCPKCGHNHTGNG